jgi:hypothetical protein
MAKQWKCPARGFPAGKFLEPVRFSASLMPKDFSHHFRSLIAPHVPIDSRVLTPSEGSDLVILITWRLGNDPLRPNKRSRLLRLVITEEALQDYASGSDGTRLAGDKRFGAWLQAKLAAFDFNHDSPFGVNPPPVICTLGTLELNA